VSTGTTRCWVVTGIPTERDDDATPCYPDARHAELTAADYRTDGHRASVSKRDHDCHTAGCDECQAPLEGDWVIHSPDPDTLQREIDTLGWIVTDDGRVLCEDCRDHPIRGGRPADRGARPIPGDVPLFDLAEATL